MQQDVTSQSEPAEGEFISQSNQVACEERAEELAADATASAAEPAPSSGADQQHDAGCDREENSTEMSDDSTKINASQFSIESSVCQDVLVANPSKIQHQNHHSSVKEIEQENIKHALHEIISEIDREMEADMIEEESNAVEVSVRLLNYILYIYIYIYRT